MLAPCYWHSFFGYDSGKWQRALEWKYGLSIETSFASSKFFKEV